MPSRELQQTPQDSLVAPAWEATPWQPEERVVLELESKDTPLQLSEEHVIQLQESDSLRLAR
ncbi:MAG: hypothetical protein E6J88_20195 [Deltaproteobacteria bacterium]|nr:MAG: hypothetical protein E6J88_20195 [Deltaproteobacteria bacterium]